MKALEASNLMFSYDTEPVLDSISFSLNHGELLGLIGPNGAGKSTLLRSLCGIISPEQGIVRIFGKNIESLSSKYRAQKIAFVPQETYFALDFSVYEIVQMGRFPYLRAFQPTSDGDRQTVQNALNIAEISSYKDRSINTLSSGERQRVVIARALAQQPDILLLDEPTSHLDLHHQHAIMELLIRLHKQGMSIIIVSHSLNLASLYCQRLVLMHGGKIHAHGSPTSLITKDMIEQIYKTKVSIHKHPITGSPQILLQPGEK